MQESVVLITSRDRDNNNRFGSGFVLRQSGGLAHVLTCLHVVRDVGGAEQILVDGLPATVVASGEAQGLDLAVLRVEGLWNKPALAWKATGEKGRLFTTAGFQMSGKDHIILPLKGNLGESGGLQSGSDRIPIWDLRITGDNTLQPGYSGSPLVDEETETVIGVVSHRQGEGKSGRAISIAALDKIWQFIDSRQLYEDLQGLGYHQQTRLFRRFVESSNIGAFLVHGPSSDYGQRWLVNRLVQKFIPGSLTHSKVIRVELKRVGRRNDINALWRELGGRVGLGNRLTTPIEIAARICQWWQTQHVFFVLHDVDCLPPSVLSELIHALWLPLVEKAETLASLGKFKLLVFLVDYEGSTENLEDTPFVERLDDQWKPQAPLRSPRLTEFSEEDLINWIEDRYSRLPRELTQHVDRTVQTILENTDNGIPERTFVEISDRCGCNWYEELEPCLKL